MKSVFTLNAHVEAMLKAANHDTAKLINAVQSSLNSADLIDETSKRGNVNLVTKGAEFKFSESNGARYRGKTDAPARFAQWHDDTAKSFKRNGDPSDVLTTAILPVTLKVWLDEKFSLNAKPAEPTGNGGVKRNGGVKAVPAPAVPA